MLAESAFGMRKGAMWKRSNLSGLTLGLSLGVLFAGALLFSIGSRWHPWSPGPRVSVQMRYEAERSVRPLHYVAVISGGDKHHWYEIPAGRSRRVTLRPGDTDDTGITLFYQYASDDGMRVWEGPGIPGGVDYAVSIVVAGGGEIRLVDEVLVRKPGDRD
jgi:hypothetical protein